MITSGVKLKRHPRAARRKDIVNVEPADQRRADFKPDFVESDIERSPLRPEWICRARTMASLPSPYTALRRISRSVSFRLRIHRRG